MSSEPCLINSPIAGALASSALGEVITTPCSLLLQLCSVEIQGSLPRAGGRSEASRTAPRCPSPAWPPWCWWAQHAASASPMARGVGPSPAASVRAPRLACACRRSAVGLHFHLQKSSLVCCCCFLSFLGFKSRFWASTCR